MARSVVGLMFTRCFWMLPVGMVIGAGTSLGYYAYVAEYQSQFTAVVPFQVVAPMPRIGSTAEPIKLSKEDVERVIQRQESIFGNEQFLSDVLKSAEFHQTDKSGQVRGWLAEQRSSPLQGLRRDLRVVPKYDLGTFEIQMSAHDAVEACELVKAATKVYVDRLQSDSRSRNAAFARRLEDAVKTAQDNYQIKSDALVDYGKRKGIDVLKSRYEIERTSLITLNGDYMREDLAASSAEQKYEAMMRTKEDGKEVELSADLQLSVESDPTLKALQTTLLNLEQEKAAQSVVVRTTDPRLNEINARIGKLDDQIVETRRKLQRDARDRMAKMLQEAAVENRFRASYLGRIRMNTEAIVTGIGQDLLVWQQRLDDLKEQGDLITKVRQQLNLAQANQATDDTLVAEMDEPTIPDEPSWPHWWAIIPVGAAAGLLMSIFAAGIAAARYRRKLNAPLAPPALPSEPGGPASASPA